jgi:signal peptide peptidase SppA
MRLSDHLLPAIDRLLNRPPLVSVLRLDGVIAAGRGPLSSGLSVATAADLIETAFAPAHQAAVALVINSPGGAAAQAALLGRRIRALADEKKIPVLAFVEDVAASGGYWLATAADEIFADPCSIVGSIGVVSAGFGLAEALRRLGIERRLYARGDGKRMLDPFLPERPEDVARLERLQDQILESFKSWVLERRAGRLRAAPETLFTGDVWTGGPAVELGLIDGLGDARSVLRARFGDKVRLRPVTRGSSWVRRLIRLQGGRGLDAGWEGVLTRLEDRLHWLRFGM